MPDSIEFNIQVADNFVKEILIARLSVAGADGFEEQKNRLKAFVPADHEDLAGVCAIIEQSGAAYEKTMVKAQNWNAAWEADFKPVIIADFCAIRAAFHAPEPSVKHDIIITPKMSFGTGHHATTYLMIQAMSKLDFNNKTVFDFGTGTGVLAVLAEKCGAEQVTAIDNDDWSINNASENFILNDCHKILLSKSETFLSGSKFNIILANINRNVILENLFSMQQHLAPGGVVLLSGLLTGDAPVITAAAGNQQLATVQQTEMNGWICLQMAQG